MQMWTAINCQDRLGTETNTQNKKGGRFRRFRAPSFVEEI
eukprot:COSAG06_NODE_31046_length_527_cov_3.752336_1_plen_39_part_01